LNIHRSQVYYQAQERLEDMCLMNEIHDLWIAHPYYGYRRIREVLVRQGHVINRKCVHRLMKVMNLTALYPKPKTSLRRREDSVYRYLLSGLKIDRPNQVWSVDITYVPMRHGFVYLVALIDVHSRYIVGWNISISLETESCIIALEKALKQATPDILNSDQGCQFTSDAWIQALLQRGIKISMDGKGRCLDNVFIERFWRSLKQEDVYLKAYETVLDARKNIDAYIDFYNHRRPHQSLNYQTPAEVYFAGKKKADSLLEHIMSNPLTHQINCNQPVAY